MMFDSFRKARRVAPRAPVMIAGTRTYAIGDIHGRSDLLEALLARIDDDDRARPASRSVLIFLGDVIDRGPDSAGVIDRLIGIRADRPSTRLLLGNHEEMFLKALTGDVPSVRAFCRSGGRETLLSYGVTEAAYERMDYAEAGAALQRVVPQAHHDFVAGFEDIVVLGDYAFVHAGVDPARSLDEQVPASLRWIRQPFLEHRGTFEKVVVHGHTIHHEVERQHNRIGLDTGAYETGRLSAICLDGSQQEIIQT